MICFKKLITLLKTVSLIVVFSSCSYGGEFNNTFIVDSLMKQKILNSKLKVDLQNNTGEKYVAYLFAENARDDAEEEYYSCIDGEPRKYIRKTGNFFIYLYDVKHEDFLPGRVKIFEGFKVIAFGVEGADMIVLHGEKEKKSDVLLISQFGACNGNFFEAYGFSKSGSHLENYLFKGKHESDRFYGRVYEGDSEDNLMAYVWLGDTEENIQGLFMYLSDQFGKIQLKVDEQSN